MRPLACADLFCGAGGTTTGCKRALAARGVAVRVVAVNHCQVAVDTHQRNHPDAAHFCVDVYHTLPIDAVPSGYLDFLMASPTCTYFSRARGSKPISRDQRYGRMTPTQVVRWCTDLEVRCLLVENVPEFVDWGPVDRVTMRPIRAKRGIYFRAWVRRLKRLGYTIEWRVLNAADYGDATTRRRLFLIGRKDGLPIRWPRPTHAKAGGADLFGNRLEKWRAAREVIDWTRKGRSIFNRKKPLSKKTIARILAGAVKFNWPEPFLVILRRHMDGQSIDGPLPAICAGGNHICLAEPVPFVIPQRSDNDPTRTVDDPMPTATAVSRMAFAAPFIFANRENNAPKDPATDPMPTNTTTTGGGIMLADPIIAPFMLAQASGGAPRSTDAPVPTIPTDGAHALVVPYYGHGRALPVSAPLPTATTKDRFGLVVPVTHADASQRARSVEDPLPTVTGAARGELAFITAAFGERPGQAPRVRSIEDPAPAICAQGRVPLVEGVHVEVYYDILLRMFEPLELARAMSFSDHETTYEFCGNKTEQTRQIGNAVPCRTAAALAWAILEPLVEAMAA